MERRSREDEALLRCIKMSDYNDQSHLQIALKEQGINMPQATLSRRLKKLNIVKVGGVYQSIKKELGTPVRAVTKLGPNLIIINTLPGHANSVAFSVDEEFVSLQSYGIAGTIAGDDTVFVAVNERQLKEACSQLKKFLLEN